MSSIVVMVWLGVVSLVFVGVVHSLGIEDSSFFPVSGCRG